MRYLVECVRYSAFKMEFYIAFDIILICLTGDCFINKLKLRDPFKVRDSPLNTTPVDFYPSINVMWINLFVFQTPDENWFAKEIGLECGFICKDDIFPILIQFQTLLAHSTVWQYCTFLLAFLLIIGFLLCSIKFEHQRYT